MFYKGCRKCFFFLKKKEFIMSACTCWHRYFHQQENANKKPQNCEKNQSHFFNSILAKLHAWPLDDKMIYLQLLQTLLLFWERFVIIFIPISCRTSIKINAKCFLRYAEFCWGKWTKILISTFPELWRSSQRHICTTKRQTPLFHVGGNVISAKLTCQYICHQNQMQ